MTEPTTTPVTDHGPADRTDLAVLAGIAGTDQRTVRTIVKTELADRTADRRTDRKARTKADRADQKRTARADRSMVRTQRRTDRRKVRAERTARRTEWIQVRADYARQNVPAVFSTVVYTMALGVAVAGQISAATAQGWSAIVGIGIAVFIEGMALSMALTAHDLRMRKERAFVPRTLTWVFAGFAAAINLYAHWRNDPVLAVVFAASSIASITNWEVRSSAKNRAALRKLGAIPEPGERFGIKRWMRYLPSTFRAWSLDIQVRVTPRAAQLLEAVQSTRTDRSAVRAHRRLVRSAAWAVRISAVRGPSAVLVAVRSAADLLAVQPVRTDLVRVDPPVRTAPVRTDRRTVDRGADRPAIEDGSVDRSVPIADPVTPAPRHAVAETVTDRSARTSVTNINESARLIAQALKSVREEYEDVPGPLTWSQVGKVIGKGSKSRITKVLALVNEERQAA